MLRVPRRWSPCRAAPFALVLALVLAEVGCGSGTLPATPFNTNE